MKFDLEVLPAKEGDCLLLHWTHEDKDKLAVIDGGPPGVYTGILRERLKELSASRPNMQLYIDLVMVSHVDNDHIIGIKEMLVEMRAEFENNVPEKNHFLRIGRLWHNTFDDIIGNKTNSYYETLTASYAAAAEGRTDPNLEEALATQLRQKGADEDDSEFVAEEIAAILAGHRDSLLLRKEYEVLSKKKAIKFSLNNPFKTPEGKATLITSPMSPKMVDGLAVGVYGPADAEVQALQTDHDTYIEGKQASAQAALAAYSDDSIPNLASIVSMIGMEHPQTKVRKSILLTGDARGDKVLKGLEQAGKLKAGERMFVNVLKVPHHGSNRNVTAEFFKRIFADVYVISANGKHGNPDRDTLEWIVDSRPKEEAYEIILTYPIAEIDKIRKKEFNKAQLRKRPEKRREWSDKTDALATFFAEKKAEGYKYKCRVSDGKKSLVVSLGDSTQNSGHP